MTMMPRWTLLVSMVIALSSSATVRAEASFAAPAFARQWQAGEALVPNFWGPLATARAGQQEPYTPATGGQRLVQYFDKGRMELGVNGVVTNGLLASELFAGQVAMGDFDGTYLSPPGIPIAGDSDNPGPTYAALSTRAKAIFDPTTEQHGLTVSIGVEPTGAITMGDPAQGDGPTSLSAFDAQLKHNIMQAFATYRDRLGLAAIGLAKSEPFATTVKVGGMQRRVIVQVFERRVLTYTESNPEAYKVEMGNIGQHYYQWRYSPPFPAAATTPAPTDLRASPITLDSLDVGRHGATAIVSFTTNMPACLNVETRTIGGPLPTTDWQADRNIKRCTPSTSFARSLGFSTGGTYEVRGFARDLVGNTVYTSNAVVVDATSPP